MYCTVDSQDGKIHNSCLVKQGEMYYPLPCCDMHILHSHFMRALNPGRSKENTETDFHCWLLQCFLLAPCYLHRVQKAQLLPQKINFVKT